MPVIADRRVFLERLALAHAEGRTLHSSMSSKPWRIVACKRGELPVTIFACDEPQRFIVASAEADAEWERLSGR